MTTTGTTTSTPRLAPEDGRRHTGSDVQPADRRPVLVAGVASLAAYVGAVVSFGSGPFAEDAAGVAAALERTAGGVRGGVLLLTLSLLLTTVVVAELARRTTRDGVAARLVLPLGVGYALLTAAAFWPFAGAVAVGQDLFGGTVSAGQAEAALVLTNTLSPLAGFVAAGFLAAVAAARAVPTWLGVSALVLAAGLLLPFVSWAVLYLLPLWVATAAVVLARRA